jgi:hypothetical protein
MGHLVRPGCRRFAPLRGAVLASILLGSCSSASPGSHVVDGSIQAGSACVDPFADALVRMRRFAPDQPIGRAELVDAALLDLDGDGTRDFFVTTEPWCGSGGCPYWLYVRERTCGRFVGRVEGRDFAARPPGRNGLFDLHYTWWLGCCRKVEQSGHFDGRHYQVSERECSLGPDGPGDWACK